MITLHITNGDAAIDVMKDAGMSGEFLPWRDVLHEGPVPQGLALDELSKVRAAYLSQAGWGELTDVQRTFKGRDTTLSAFRDYAEVVLWFEHDLYDQLQLVQILAWLIEQDDPSNVSLIQTDDYLGLMSPEQMAALQGTQKRLTMHQLDLARNVWRAFTAPDPTGLVDILNGHSSALPHLHAAVLRLLEQYPSKENGLNRTERQILGAVQKGIRSRDALFSANQDADEVKFMGDAAFWPYLDRMIECDEPLITADTNVTEVGQAVLRGERDWLDVAPIDRWIGGVHLQGKNVWRWDGVELTRDPLQG